MRKEDKRRLWFSARDKLSGSWNSYANSKKLAALLDLSYPERCYYRKLNYTPDVVRVLKALAGPHGQVVRKILEARK